MRCFRIPTVRLIVLALALNCFWTADAVSSARKAKPRPQVADATDESPNEIRVTSPKETAQACKTAKPGDIIVLADGIYTDGRFVVRAEGKADAPITFRAETPGGAILTGSTMVTITGSHIVMDGFVFDQAWHGVTAFFTGATHCRLTNCAFVECGKPTNTFTNIITLRGRSQHNRVDHCYMQANLSIGVGVRVMVNDFENTYNQIDHNYFRNITARKNNGQEAIQLGKNGYTPQHTIVEYNLFESASGDHLEIISNKTRHNTIRYNTFRNCHGMISLRVGSHATINGNFIFNCTKGIRVHDGFHTIVNNYIQDCEHGIYVPCGYGDSKSTSYQQVYNSIFAHNTIVNCKVGIILGGPNGLWKETECLIPSGNHFIKNLIISKRGLLVEDKGSRTTLWRGNITWATGTAKPGLQNDGITHVAPGLVEKDGLMRLARAKSAATNLESANLYDFNTPVPGANVDMDGQPRDEKTDAGADEFSKAPITRRPLKPADVGPVWMKGDPTRIKRIPSPQPVPKWEWWR